MVNQSLIQITLSAKLRDQRLSIRL